jgi:predicted Fe-Mo cluster-binding NifX family protein
MPHGIGGPASEADHGCRSGLNVWSISKRVDPNLFIFISESLTYNNMKRLAIPIFQNRVSPVLDSCRHMLIVEIDKNTEMDREQIYLGTMSLTERCGILKKLEVSIVICGGVSEVLANLVTGSNIQLLNGIAGEIDAVITAFLEDRLDRPQFYMPGFRQDNRHP